MAAHLGPVSRRRALGVAGGATAALALAACSSDSSSPGDHLHGGSTGEALGQPPVVESSAGVLEAELVAKPSMVLWGSARRYALTYSGQVTGPTLSARPGDLLKLRLRNELNHATNLHTHGLHVSPEGKGDNVYRMAMPGETIDYEIQLPSDHRTGTFWYHPHAHEMVASQVSGGLAGAILVRGGADEAPLATTAERVLVLTNPKVGTTSSVLSATHAEKQNGREGDVLLVNGQLEPVLSARQGDVEHWRIVNATPSLYLKLEATGLTPSLIGGDQGRLERPVGVSQVLLAPGQRVELLVPVMRSGRSTLTATSMSRGTMSHDATSHGGSGSHSMDMGSMDMGNMGHGTKAEPIGDPVTVLTLDAAKGSTTPVLPATTNASPLPAPGRAEVRRSVMLGSMAMGDGEFVIDGAPFDPGRIDIEGRLGTTEEWVLVNGSMMDHPFHLHTWPFYVVSSSAGNQEPGWADTVWVPVGARVTIRVPLTTYPGTTVYHCHVLDHEDLGMMGQIKVS